MSSLMALTAGAGRREPGAARQARLLAERCRPARPPAGRRGSGGAAPARRAWCQQVLGWWGPIYNTDSGNVRYVSSPDTELAWAGDNAAIRKHARDFSLRLYRTEFANPFPGKEITTLDYLSRPSANTPENVAPFLVGLTTGQ